MLDELVYALIYAFAGAGTACAAIAVVGDSPSVLCAIVCLAVSVSLFFAYRRL